MIVIPMAGNSSRFYQAGFTRPKYELPVGKDTLFARCVGSFEAYFASESFLFVCRPGVDAERFVHAECAKLGLARYQAVVLPEPTRGQAETVLKGLEQVHAEGAERLLIFNIDTIRPGFRFAREYVESDGCLEVFPGDGEHWSFVRPAGDGSQRVLETTEKRRISNLCSTGLYYFARLGDFQRLCTAAVSDADNFCREWRELYVAPLYNAFIAGGADVRYHQVDPKEVVFSGTPQEYEDMLRGHSAATSSPAP